MTCFVSLAAIFPLTIYATDIDELKKVLQTRVDRDNGLLLAVGIIEDNQTKFTYVSNPEAMQPEELNGKSLFEIGSVTKSFNGILLADLVLQGKVKLDDPVAQYLPDGVTMPANGGHQITLRHLVTHTSCLPRSPTNWKPKDWANPYADYTTQNLYAFLSSYTLNCEPGRRHEYSNVGMGLLGHVLSLNSKMPYEELVKQHILEPLNMEDTVITLSSEQQQRLTSGHNDGGEIAPNWDLPTFAAAGALKSTPKDMMRFLAANMGMIDTPLSDAIEMSHTFQFEINGTNLSMGLAWLITKNLYTDIIWHNGGTGGYTAYIGFDNQQRGIFVLANYMESPKNIGEAILNNDLASLEYKADTIDLSQRDRDKLVGKYLCEHPTFGEINLNISEEDGNLFSQLDFRVEAKLTMLAKSKTEFFFKYTDDTMSFYKDENNKDQLIYEFQGENYGCSKL